MSALAKPGNHPRSTLLPEVPVLVLLAIGLTICVLVSISTGAVTIPVGSILSGRISDMHSDVLTRIRMPRVLLAVIVGAALAVSGAAMQGLFRNPLADPGLIGISSSAALMVAVVIVFGGKLGGFAGLYGVSFAAFLGGLASCFLIFRLARHSGTFSATYLLLAGIAISALAGAGTGFLTFLSDEQQLRDMAFWTMGSVGGALWPSVVVAASLITPPTILLIRNARNLNISLLGEDEARCLGVDSDRLKQTIIFCTALSVGAAVAVSGIIGFVGLIVPHLVRLLIGSDHRILIPASALLGAILLVLADTLARTLVAPAEIPVGILTSLIGGPFFLWLLIKQFSSRFSL